MVNIWLQEVWRGKLATIRNVELGKVELADLAHPPWWLRRCGGFVRIAGVERFNSALEFSFTWAMSLPGAWMMGALALVAAVALRVRGR